MTAERVKTLRDALRQHDMAVAKQAVGIITKYDRHDPSFGGFSRREIEGLVPELEDFIEAIHSYAHERNLLAVDALVLLAQNNVIRLRELRMSQVEVSVLAHDTFLDWIDEQVIAHKGVIGGTLLRLFSERMQAAGIEVEEVVSNEDAEADPRLESLRTQLRMEISQGDEFAYSL